MNRIVLAALCLSIGAALPAAAQTVPNPSSIGIGKAQSGRPPEKEQPPSAVPGARAEPTAVAPALKSALDLPPNEALFDAINRGDMAVAKDAVNRGADLNATNVLGLTPIELAVDLGRNQISFYLLSLRGGTVDPGRSGPPPQQVAAKPPTRAERLATQRAERAARSQNAAAEAVPAAPRTARLFAGNGGQPIPQAGFLGFDANR